LGIFLHTEKFNTVQPRREEARMAQYDKQDPTKQYADITIPKQEQPGTGLDSKMKPLADHGEQTYVGLGRLKGRKALITGGDSGIGRAVAIAFAREGADVVISYLPSEQSDADKAMPDIGATGRKAVAIAGDLRDEHFARELVHKADRPPYERCMHDP